MTPEEQAAADKVVADKAAADKAAADAAAIEKKKKRFSDEDQEFIDTLVNDVFARGHKKAADEATKQFAEATASIATLTAKITELEKPKPPKKAPVEGEVDTVADKVKQLQAQLEERDTAFKTIQADRDGLAGKIEGATKIARAAQFQTDFDAASEGITFISKKQVFKDVVEELRHETDGTITVMNLRTGQPRMTSEMKAFTLTDFLAEYAKKNPHMVSTDVDGGTGGSESRRLKTTVDNKGVDVTKMSNEEFEAFHAKVLSGRAPKLTTQ